MIKKINKIKLLRNLILLLLALGIVFMYFANRYIKTRGFDNLGDFISNYYDNKKLVEGVEPEQLKILTSDEDFQFLKEKRDEDLARGIQLNEGDNYVKCRVVSGGDTIKGEMRLKGHMTDHLEGDKWSFRVKTDDEVKGMYRFSLQNPGTRNYAYEWVYHQLLKQEGVIHLKYDFINLTLNENDLGIYAIEEHFGQHIPRDNNRPPGAILRWNPTLYWEGRINEMEKNYVDNGYAHYSTTFPEAYDEGVVKRDSELIYTYQTGARLLEEFRRSEKTASQVFDIDKMAKFHAIIDLVGGYHSLDWSDVKFFYNSDSKLVEPVGYESFSVRETNKIAGQRTPEDYATIGFEYHDQLFADPEFFASYIENLERICTPAYLNKFEKGIQSELNKKLGVLGHEYAYTKFSFATYYKNIRLINDNLNLPKAFHAFLEESTDSTATISVTPVCDYPIEIVSLIDNGKDEYPISKPFVLPPKPRRSFATYFTISFKHHENKLNNLQLTAKIPGSNTIFKVEVSDLPSYKSVELDTADYRSKGDTNIVWNESGDVGIFKSQKILIDKPIHVGYDQKLIVRSGQSVVFEDAGSILVEGELFFIGTEDAQIVCTTKNTKIPSIQINGGAFTAVQTEFSNIENKFMTINKGKLSLQYCGMAEVSADLISALESEITLIHNISGRMESLGKFDRCIVKMTHFLAKNGGVFIASTGSYITLNDCVIDNYNQVSMLNYNSICTARLCSFNQFNTAFELNNCSNFEDIKSRFTNGNLGFKVDLNTRIPGDSGFKLYNSTEAFKKKEERRAT
ncbi:hypothetical protein N8987_05620 [Crocinitomix sp.]|nr:hypothetical protein [Crocinitomix sp.]